ncbi:MAG: hypothetical protein LCH52_02110 [Bacteroidetes bacterium]|nr:hypothetical protein [Bacteroidota bacterium]
MFKDNQPGNFGQEKITIVRLMLLVAVYTPVVCLIILFSPFHVVRLMVEKFMIK